MPQAGDGKEPRSGGRRKKKEKERQTIEMGKPRTSIASAANGNSKTGRRQQAAWQMRTRMTTARAKRANGRQAKEGGK